MSDKSPITGMSYYQHTLADTFTCVGRGLHTGLRVVMSVTPAEANTGYVFVRRDVESCKAEVPARWYMVTDTHLSTTISNNMGVRVSTIEHLTAALHACGVDNARIVLDAPEVPIMDGSAYPFVEIIQKIGLQQQNQERRAILLKQPVYVSDDLSSASLEPAPTPWVDIEIDFESEVIGKQRLSLPISESVFAEEISPARTFGFEEQVETLRELGFAKGSSIKNAILISNSQVVNQEGLRFVDEFVRHKFLDAVGDLSLAGAVIIGQFNGNRSGHAVNNQLLRELMTNENTRAYTTLRQADMYWSNELARAAMKYDSAASEVRPAALFNKA
ncbi:UDP-3-O-[3-hydroxymyristoyl] N-acetylglucosamine deacetylase [Alteromonadaceae bacterium 2753L.S.0a.02]|nr:UDP-3-O-[3-hydroxymyristoyl] N-acetylglucosamine deacetylase [Alteromonadaceae bacterium 2753L.S.0a.02]